MSARKDEPENLTDTVVAVARGRHKGRVGYCDSDFANEAIVFPGSFGDDYVVVRSTSLRPATAKEERAYRKAFMSSPERFYARTSDMGN